MIYLLIAPRASLRKRKDQIRLEKLGQSGCHDFLFKTLSLFRLTLPFSFAILCDSGCYLLQSFLFLIIIINLVIKNLRVLF
jgi:hypothetical protein